MLTVNELKDNLLKRYEKKEFEGKKVGIFEEPLPVLSNLRIGPNVYPVIDAAFLVMIDEAPGAFWHHPVTYELHSVHSGEVKPIYEKRPVSDPPASKMKILYAPFITIKPGLAVPPKESSKPGVLKAFMPPPENKNKHAILFGGPNGNFQYDIANMRDVLVNRYAFGPDRVLILMDDGQPFVDEKMGISIRADGAATREHLDETLLSFARGGERELGKDDTLFIYIFSHGGKDEQTHYFATFGLDREGNEQEGYYYDFELAGRISYISCGQLVITLIACESAGFQGPIINAVSQNAYAPQKTVVTAAALGKQLAWTLRFDETDFLESRHNAFSVYFYSALNEGYPSSVWDNLPDYARKSTILLDTDGDGRVSVRDAFRWADYMMRNHHITTLLGMELAGYAEFPEGVGETVFLGEPQLMVQEYCRKRQAYDIFFLDPAALAEGENGLDDRKVLMDSQYFWGNTYHAEEVNLIAAVVYNTGTAPCHDVTVEFRVGHIHDYFLVGKYNIDCIDTQDYAYAYVSWETQSLLNFHKIKNVTVRVSCPADPSPPFMPPAGELKENRHLAQLKEVHAKTVNPAAPFDKFQEFNPVYQTFRRLMAEGHQFQQALLYSWVFKLVFNSPRFESFEFGCLQGKVNIQGTKPGEDVTGWVSVSLRVDQGVAFQKDQSVDMQKPLDKDGSYLFQLLPAGTYTVHVECPVGIADDTVEIKKYEVTGKDFTFKNQLEN